MLGSYHYVLEAEDQQGITEEEIRAVCGMEGVRFAGCFDVVEP